MNNNFSQWDFVRIKNDLTETMYVIMYLIDSEEEFGLVQWAYIQQYGKQDVIQGVRADGLVSLNLIEHD